MSLASPLMQLHYHCVHVFYVFAFALTFQSVHVAIENVNVSLTQGGNNVIWLANLESPVVIGRNKPGSAGGN